jgi:uncharacterized protein YcaQ
MTMDRRSRAALPEPAVTLASAEARRIALVAQGLGKRPAATPRGPAAVHRTIARIGLVQIDSVNVLVRSHYLPLFSRLGPYARELLDRAAYARTRRRLFEYWGHEASLLPLDLHPLLRWRMERARRGEGVWGGLARFGREQRDFIAAVLAQVRARGPLSASELEEGGRRQGNWWGWSHGKQALEWLFWAGEVTTATRRNFERMYDIPARVLPAAVLGAPTPDEAQAQRALLLIAARALGVATERDLRDYFRLAAVDARARVLELVEAGDLVPARVEGWKPQAYLPRELRVPRPVEACALLSPFDSLVWERQRTERLFGFHYRLEIYTPVQLRKHGYYVLPFLLGDRLVARVDLKADRPSSCLRVLGGHAEPGIEPCVVAGPLAHELSLMAAWLDLERVDVTGRTELSREIRRAVRMRS